MCLMNTVLKKFVNESLFDASAALLHHLHIIFNEVTRVPVPFEDLYPLDLSKALREVLVKVEHTYFIGTVDESSLTGRAETLSAEEVTARASEGKYTGMMIFAVELHSGATLTRSESATLTRGFNRIASAQPVILFIKQGNELALSTCERSEYTQQWRDGEKLGKVSILRGINCLNPHRGHIDILASIGDKTYPNYEELYKHWMEVFSSDLLTKKFYSELSDWYAWAVQVARFPNDLTTDTDDDKFNHESCIRLITRLIFVWFLKQKHLIPEEFFDERYIKEHFIDEFNPHDRRNLLYNPEESKYYRLILQNLFFAMLNCPIVAEGKDTPNNRRFRGDGQKGFLRDGYNVNNLMRYKADFKEGGADEFVQMANSHVPFLNGGLFDCLDKKPEKLYYDGFSERKESLEQLYLPDWLFFGDEVGRSIDLSQWYGDNNKKSVSARGIIDILKRYNFTIEENTPLDQEVSLDPELLGKAFENLLASYNPETKTSARKQTGSFYTPREIVQYMVDESLVAHLKRTCGDELEPEYRKLLSYSTEETSLNEEQRKSIMQAVYNCRVLDPACGSGAFPMGVLQQLVHILRQLDPTNDMWKDFMIDLAIEQSKLAFAEDEETERKARLADIEEAFNKSINDPDYARKLYLIEHCIYGVDIQPIAVQISKLRFFISLVVDQKPTNDAIHNFGIRPLPNLESKFVAANTLIPLGYDASLFESTKEILDLKERLKELNHKVFLAKRNVDKQRLKKDIKEKRKQLAQAIEDTGFVSQSAAQKLADWDMFDQNASSSFFDPEWMFGVKDGFDIVVANPPYMDYRDIPEGSKHILNQYITNDSYRPNFFLYFIEKGYDILKNNGSLCYINPITMLSTDSAEALRKHIIRNTTIKYINDVSHFKVFESAQTYCIVWQFSKNKNEDYGIRMNSCYDFEGLHNTKFVIPIKDVLDDDKFIIPTSSNYSLFAKIERGNQPLNYYAHNICWGTSMTGYGKMKIEMNEYDNLPEKEKSKYAKIVQTADIKQHYIEWKEEFLPKSIYSQRVQKLFKQHKIVVARVTKSIQSSLDFDNYYVAKSTLITDVDLPLPYIQAIIQSKLIDYWYKTKFESTHMQGDYIRFDVPYLSKIPVFANSDKKEIMSKINFLSEQIHTEKAKGDNTTLKEEHLNMMIYHLYNLTYDEILIIDPNTPITREEYESEML